MSLSAPATPVSPSSVDGYYQSVKSHTPIGDGEIQLNEGDIVSSLKDLGNGWCLGKNVSNSGAVGIFPSSCVSPMSSLFPTAILASPTDDLPPEETRTLSLKRKSSYLEAKKGVRKTSPDWSRKKRALKEKRIKSRDRRSHPASGKDNFYVALCSEGQYLMSGPRYPATNHSKGDRVGSGEIGRSDELNVNLANNALPNSPQRTRQKKPRMVVKPNQDRTTCEHHAAEPLLNDSGKGPQRELRDSDLEHASPRLRLVSPPKQLTLSQTTHSEFPQDEIVVRADESRDRDCSTADVTRPFMCDTAIVRDLYADNAAQEENISNELLDEKSPTTERKADDRSTHYPDYRSLNPFILAPPSGSYKRGVQVTNLDGSAMLYTDPLVRYRTLRLILSFIAGLTVGGVLFIWSFYHLEYPPLISLVLSGFSGLVLSILLALSRRVCCIVALVFPSLCTSRGRVAFMILMFGFLLSGPTSNVYLNMAEVSRSMSCSAEQSYNQTMLLLKPFDAMMVQLNRTIVQLQESAENVNRGLQPLKDGLNDVDEDVRNGRIQLTGTRKACKNLLETAFEACITGIHKAQHQCLGVMGALGTVYHHARDVLDKINPDRWSPRQSTPMKKRQVLAEDGR